MGLQKDPLAFDLRQQDRLINNFAGGSDRQPFGKIANVIRVKANTAMGAELVDAHGSDGPMNSVAGYAEADPVLAERIFRAWRHLCLHVLSFPAHLFLNGLWDIPNGILLYGYDLKAASGRGPVWAAEPDWIVAD